MTAPDVAIVGGGIVGASLAVELAARGLAVRLYERTAVAAGASGRNSGAIWHPVDPVMAALYRETLAIYRALPDRLAAWLPAGHEARAFALDGEPAGLLVLDHDPASLRALDRADQAAGAAGVPELRSELLDPRAVRSLEPALADGLWGLRTGIGYPVAPAAATRAMAALALALGAEIRTGAPVLGLARVDGRVTGVRTSAGVEPAGRVAVAAGPWTPGLVDPRGTWRPIAPAWGVVVELRLADPPRHVLEAAPAATGDHDAHGFGLVTAGDRSSLGWTFLEDEPDPWAWEATLRATGARHVPAIAETPTAGIRACARPVTPDGRPLVGVLPGTDGLVVVAGHGPWGMSTGPASAAHAAALVAGEPDPRSPAVRAGTDAARFGTPDVGTPDAGPSA